jgi:hypothetical protein
MESRTTALMRAHCEQSYSKILQDIEAREEMPFKARTPEIATDIQAIRKTCLAARRRAVARDALLLVVYLYVLFSTVAPLVGRDPAELLEGGLPIGPLLLPYAVAAVACFAWRYVGRRQARAALENASLDNLALVDPEGRPPEQTEVIVSGGYSPFVGAGFETEGWSFTVDVTEPADAGKPVDLLDLDSLYGETQANFARLLSNDHVLTDTLFVDGRDVRNRPGLQPRGEFSQPARTIPTADIPTLMKSNDRELRHYKCLRSVLWSGQLAISAYYRFAKRGEVLFSEVRIFVLPPLREEFRACESLPKTPTLPDLLSMLVLSLVDPLWRWMPVLLGVYEWIGAGMQHLGAERRRRKANKKLIEADRRYNYGWPASLRESWSSGSTYERYFQQVDQDFNVKMIKQALLTSLLASLERRNISTESFKGASSKIFNEGIIISGGSVTADSLTAGRRARSSVDKRAPASQKPATV